jgi:hypothetical protein
MGSRRWLRRGRRGRWIPPFGRVSVDPTQPFVDPAIAMPIAGSGRRTSEKRPARGAPLLRAAAARTVPPDGKTAVVEATAVLRGVTRRVTSSRPLPLPWPLL